MPTIMDFYLPDRPPTPKPTYMPTTVPLGVNTNAPGGGTIMGGQPGGGTLAGGQNQYTNIWQFLNQGNRGSRGRQHLPGVRDTRRPLTYEELLGTQQQVQGPTGGWEGSQGGILGVMKRNREELGPKGWGDILPAIGRGLEQAAEGVNMRNLLSGIFGEEYATKSLGPDTSTDEYKEALKNLTDPGSIWLPRRLDEQGNITGPTGQGTPIQSESEYLSFMEDVIQRNMDSDDYQRWLDEQAGVLEVEEEEPEYYPYYGYGGGGGWGGGGWGGSGWGGSGYEQDDWMNWFKNMYWNVD